MQQQKFNLKNHLHNEPGVCVCGSTYPGCTHHSLHTNTQRVHTALPMLSHYLVNQQCLKTQLRLEIVTCYELLCFHTTFSVLKETKIGHRDGSAGKGCCQEKHSDWSSITDTRIKMEAENRLQENCTLISACVPPHTQIHTHAHIHARTYTHTMHNNKFLKEV